MLAALAARRPVPRRVAMVVAHPDDETIAAGGSLALMPELLLVHVTDGAPCRLADGERLGFATPAAYAAAREAELQAALAVAGVTPERRPLGVPDQDASFHMGALVEALVRAFAEHGTEVVLTHAYEGGHPDHDASACAAHLAAQRFRLPVLEFAGYHAGPGGGMRVQHFLPGPPETRIALDPEASRRKQAMLDCFATQADILGQFGASVERFRLAPAYDFTAAPHEGPLNYENWGWEMTGDRWRVLAAGALRCPV